MMNPDTPTVTSWVLVHHPDGDPPDFAVNWTFRTYDKNNIQVFHNNNAWHAWQEDYVNVYYPTAEARTLWNKLVAKGAKRRMK